MEEPEEDPTDYILQGSTAIRTLLTLATSSRTLSLSKPSPQESYYHTAETNLQCIPHLVTSFVIKAAKLRKHCLESQDVLVPHIIDWYMEHAARALDRVSCETNEGHPRELTFRIHGLSRVLEELCKDAWCLGRESEYCTHRCAPGVGDCGDDDIVGVSVVHPGRGWVDFQRYLFAGVKGVTMLNGEIFGLVALAMVRERWGDRLFDEVLWGVEYRGVSEVDVFWLGSDDSVVGCDVSGISCGVFVGEGFVKCDEEFSLSENTAQPMDTPLTPDVQTQYYKAPVQSNDRLDTCGEVSEVKSPNKPSRRFPKFEGSVRFTGASYGPRPQKQRDHHSCLRAGRGVRVPSFLSPNGDSNRTKIPSPSISPHPFLRRGDGERRRTQTKVDPPSPSRWKG